MMGDDAKGKEAKLKYGEILREQIRSDAERKKLQRLETSQKPKLQNIIGYTQRVNQNRSMANESVHTDPTFIDKKELLQKQMEAFDSFPFGKSGRTYPQDRLPPQTQKPSPYAQSPSYQMIPQFVSPPSVLPSNYQIIPQIQYQPSHPVQYMQPPQPPQQNYYTISQPIPATFSPPKERDYSYSPTKEESRDGGSMNVLPWPSGSTEIENANRKRNLLKYQNISHIQLQAKQTAKEKLQNELLQQMNEASRKKQDIKRREEMENEKIERQNQRYFEEIQAREKEKINDENKKKQARVDQEQNQKEMLQRAQEEAMLAKKRSAPVVVSRMVTQLSPQRTMPTPKNLSALRVQTNYGVQPRQNTQSSRIRYDTEYYEQTKSNDSAVLELQRKNEAQKRSRERYFEEVKKDVDNIRNEIIGQSEMYKMEMEKVKMDAQKARLQKEKSQFEFLRLKEEFDRNRDNEKLKVALSKTDQYYEQNYKSTQEAASKKHNYQLFQKQDYQMPTQKQTYTEPAFDHGLKTLTSESIKIPCHPSQRVPTYDPKSTQYQPNQLHAPHSTKKPKFNHSSDSLDHLVKSDHLNHHKWGSISSVDSSVTHQIERLLKQHRSPIEINDSDKYFSNRMSGAGKLSLNKSSHYKDFSLSSDTDNYTRLNKHNQRRLDRLRDMSIEQDEELGRLDTLLDNY